MGPGTTIDAASSRHAREGSIAPIAYLVVHTADGTQVVDVYEGDQISIGRAEDASIRLDDSKASREHARVECTGGGLLLFDLGSRNGTRVNRDRQRAGTPRALASGDVLWIGDTEILVATPTFSREEDAAPSGAPPVEGLVIADQAMTQVFRMVERVAPQDTTVLLLGETGVGKEVIAEQIHRRSRRAEGPFVRVNCGALPENLIESELFGHEKGAFTGADRRRIGHFETAQGGTLFLDEIGELRLDLQAKLLRALEARAVTRVGGRGEIAVDVRIVAASNRDLEAEAKAGRFRSDLFFRLSTFVLQVPPLRERPNEIGLLAELFVQQIALKMGRTPPRLDDASRRALEAYTWPGNVRELRNVIERALVLVEGDVIRTEHLPLPAVTEPRPPSAGSIRSQLETIEHRAIEEALAAERGNQTRAARRLGMSRRALLYKLEKYGLTRRDRGR